MHSHNDLSLVSFQINPYLSNKETDMIKLDLVRPLVHL